MTLKYDTLVERNILYISQSEEIHQPVYGWNFYLQCSTGQMDTEKLLLNTQGTDFTINDFVIIISAIISFPHMNVAYYIQYI
jgi:hypothetical protein